MAVCFVCNSKLYGERTRVCSSITPHSNSPYPDKICELMGEEFVVIITPSDHMCKRCTSLLNHFDKLENDLKLVKNALLSYIQKKYGLLPADQPVQSIEVVNGNLRTDDLEVGQRKVPSGLTIKPLGERTVREPSTSAGASSNASSKIKQDSSKMKIYKCGFCSFQSKDLGHVRFHMRSHMKKNNEKTNQTATRTVTQQQPQQQQNQPHQLMGIQNKQQQPYKQPQQQKKRLYRCQVCSASFDTRVDCLEHIHKDHNQQQSVAEEKETEVAVFQPHDVPNSVENHQAAEKNDDGHLLDGKGAMNNADLDMLFNDDVPIKNSEVPTVQETISENTPVQAELLQENHEISGTNEDVGDMEIGGNEAEADHLDIESMLAAIHNDVAPPNDGGNPQNLL